MRTITELALTLCPTDSFTKSALSAEEMDDFRNSLIAAMEEAVAAQIECDALLAESMKNHSSQLIAKAIRKQIGKPGSMKT